MSDVILRKSVQTRLAVLAVSEALVGYLRGVAERARHEESGQDLIEYMGIIILVAAAITAIGVSGLGTKVGNLISKDINSVINSK